MQYKSYYSLTLLLLLILCQGVVSAQMDKETYHPGLTFTAHTKNQDERTGLNLTPEKSMKFSKDGFSLEFDLRLREELHTYGYVCRIVSENSTSFDMIAYLLESEFKFLLTKVNKVITTSSIHDSVQIVKDEWIKVKLFFNKENIKVVVGDRSQEIGTPFTTYNDIKIYFGANKDVHFYTNDVPPMTIKNIKVRDEKGIICHQWDLSTHTKNGVYDEITKSIAIADNPIWEIDKHTQWKKVASFVLDTDGTNINPLPHLALDSTRGRVFIVTKNKILIYNIDNNETETITPRKGVPYFRVGASSQVIFDQAHNQLISYNPDLPKLNYYSFEENEWSEENIIEIDTHQHHNKFINQRENKLIVFGGYGIHRYNAQLSKIGLQPNSTWSHLALDTLIQPRYLSALCSLDEDNIVIMGGYGSASGKQEESPRNYYDLHKLNTTTGKSECLWSFANEKNHYTFSNSMVADVSANKIYVLTYNNDRYYSSICLSSFDIETDNPEMQVISDSIKYNFLDIKSYCDLFLYRKNSSLYALVQQEDAPGESTLIEIYSLAFPPLSKVSIHAHESSKKKETLLLVPLACLLLGLVLITALFYYRKKKRKAKRVSSFTATPTQEQYGNREQARSSIFLLGGFRIFDKEGRNITGEFSPTIKQIMIFLLLSSVKNNKGTTSQRLDETFWFGMDKESASNNRRVNIRKLRLLLQNIGAEIEVINKNSYWFLNIGKGISCDYQNILSLINQLDKGNATYKELISQIVDIASLGLLLPNIETEWVDDYKAQFSTKVVNTLLEAIHQPAIVCDSKLLLEIADIILLHDRIDEDAIRIKCRLLYKMKQKGLSKQSYDKFCEDYIRLLNAQPDFSYEDVIGDLMNN